MKNLFMSLLFIGMTSMGYSQYDPSNGQIENSSIDFVFTNPDYIDGVQSKVTPDYVKFLEGIAGDWDVTKTAGFDGREELFRVVFKSNRGQIKVAFDEKGKIKSATERFKDVNLPAHVRREIEEKYPNWRTVKNSYIVNYRAGKKTTKILRVKLEKAGVKKSLKMADTGILL